MVEFMVRVDLTTEDFGLSKYAPSHDRQSPVNRIDICPPPVEFTGYDLFCEGCAISTYNHGTDILPDCRDCSNREINRSEHRRLVSLRETRARFLFRIDTDVSIHT